MPTAREYGLMFGLPTDPTLIAPLIGEPSVKWLKEFGERFEDSVNGNRTPTNIGKFVAFNTFIVMAPFPSDISHDHIMAATRLKNAERIANEVAQAQSEGMRLLPFPADSLTDAGLFRINRDDDGNPEDLTLFSESGIHGGADAAGRQRTAELTQAALNGIAVKLSRS